MAIEKHPHILKELLLAGASLETDDYNMEPLVMASLSDCDPESIKTLMQV